MDKTASYPSEKRKAILDGMLFEVFFDPNAKLRSEIKGNFFDEIFDLQKHTALKESFEFISETLVQSRGAFYAVPGRNHLLSVSVVTKKVKESFRVEAVYVDGIDILHAADEESADDDLDARMYAWRTAGQFEEQLSKELVVPSRSLKVIYTAADAATAMLRVPYGYTVRRR